MQYHYNDNELLYLINEGNDSALKVMYMKYVPLIKKRIFDFKIDRMRYEDFFQEGLMMLDKAIKTFNPIYNKSFNKYFDLILQRKYIRLVQNYYAYVNNVTLVENSDDFPLYEEKSDVLTMSDFDSNMLSKFEYEVLVNAFEKNMPARDISSIMNCDVRKVYNAISRGKKKIKASIKNKQ